MKLPSSKCLTAVAGTIGLCVLNACGSGSGSGASRLADEGNAPPPVAPRSELKLHGEVLAFDTGMIDGADINIWVQAGDFGYSYWWANGPLQADGLGEFEADLPRSGIDVYAAKGGYVQPCGVHMDVQEDADVRVEMQSIASLKTLNPLRPQLSSEPSVTGLIYENTPSGRKPIAGANLWAGDALGISYASTVSDLAGGFYLCRLPAVAEVAISKVGYKMQWIGPFDPTQPTVIKVALEREGSPTP